MFSQKKSFEAVHQSEAVQNTLLNQIALQPIFGAEKASKFWKYFINLKLLRLISTKILKKLAKAPEQQKKMLISNILNILKKFTFSLLRE